ncbi:dynein regulatory complex protein 9-like [Galleria mellonella]|uniref:Dynein regulatory complex protein 9 n=1 Tax=Galleria mellonella TaxID=7137 RepID=A0ABM3MZ70_GALME|nr:dynein regulatory complex protein 9-like [Galleria mellonella]
MNVYTYQNLDELQGFISLENPSETSVIDPYSLPYFQTFMFASVLEDTITKLRILNECNNEMRISKTMVDLNRLLALKYNVEQPATMDELKNVNPKKLNCIEYKLNKLDADRKYFGDVLIDTYLDLSLNKKYSALADHVRRIVDRNEHAAFLIQDEAKNRLVRRELNKQYRQQRNHNKSVMYDTDVAIERLKSLVEDAALNAEVRKRYVENWQNARTEQHHQTIRDKEFGSSETIEYYKQKTDHEQRVHTEVELLMNITVNETLQKVESWMNKYDKDMEAIDLRIQIMKNNHKNAYEKRIQLEETLEEHVKLMKNWIHFKEDREKARLYREKMDNAAVTVQAWWRGLLVRNQLGPYKPLPKKKGASVPSGKKKK